MVIGRHAVVGAMRLRRAVDRGAADHDAVPVPSRARQRRPAVRRLRGAAQHLHARGRGRAPAAARSPGAWASASAPHPRRWTSSASRSSRSGTVTDVIVVVMPQDADRDSSRHALHPGGPRTLRRLPALLPGPGAAGGAAPAQGRGGVHEMPDFFAALREVGLPLEPVFCRRAAAHQPGAGAVELGLQLRGGPPGRGDRLPAERGDARRARARRVPRGALASTSWPSTTGSTPSTAP